MIPQILLSNLAYLAILGTHEEVEKVKQTLVSKTKECEG